MVNRTIVLLLLGLLLKVRTYAYRCRHISIIVLIQKSKPSIFEIDTGRQSVRMLDAGRQKAYSNCYICLLVEVNCQLDAWSQRAFSNFYVPIFVEIICALIM